MSVCTVIYIAPHERYEAIEAYHDWLSEAQINLIKEADDDKQILLQIRPKTIRETIVEILED